MIIEVANKYDMTVEEVFIVCCTCGQQNHNLERTIADWEHGRVPVWMIDELIDILANRIIPVPMKKGA